MCSRSIFIVLNLFRWILIVTVSPAFFFRQGFTSELIAPSSMSQHLPAAFEGVWKGAKRTYVTWLQKNSHGNFDVFLSYDENGSRKFSKPFRINRDHEQVITLDRGGPQLGIDDQGRVYVAWNEEKGIRLIQSTDGANHFKNSHYLSLNRKANHCHPRIALSSKGKVFLFWTEGSNLIGSQFEPGRSQPTVPKKILRNSFGSVQECSPLQAQVNSNGVVALVYRGQSGSSGYGVFSLDGGRSFGAPLQITETREFRAWVGSMNQLLVLAKNEKGKFELKQMDLGGRSNKVIPLTSDDLSFDLFEQSGKRAILWGNSKKLGVLDDRDQLTEVSLNLIAANDLSWVKGKGDDALTLVWVDGGQKSNVRIRDFPFMSGKNH